MDAVRGVEDPLPPGDQLRSYSTEQDYTTEWVNRVRLSERAHSTCPITVTGPGTRRTQQGISRSAPALSIRSGANVRAAGTRRHGSRFKIESR